MVFDLHHSNYCTSKRFWLKTGLDFPAGHSCTTIPRKGRVDLVWRGHTKNTLLSYNYCVKLVGLETQNFLQIMLLWVWHVTHGICSGKKVAAFLLWFLGAMKLKRHFVFIQCSIMTFPLIATSVWQKKWNKIYPQQEESWSTGEPWWPEKQRLASFFALKEPF